MRTVLPFKFAVADTFAPVKQRGRAARRQSGRDALS